MKSVTSRPWFHLGTNNIWYRFCDMVCWMQHSRLPDWWFRNNFQSRSISFTFQSKMILPFACPRLRGLFNSIGFAKFHAQQKRNELIDDRWDVTKARSQRDYGTIPCIGTTSRMQIPLQLRPRPQLSRMWANFLGATNRCMSFGIKRHHNHWQGSSVQTNGTHSLSERGPWLM